MVIVPLPVQIKQVDFMVIVDLAIFSVLLAAGPLASDKVSAGEPQQEFRSFRFSAIRIPIWVTDRHGLPRTDLTARDFKLYVDGKRVAIEGFMSTHEQPIELAYLLDLSGSMEIGGKVAASVNTLDRLMEMQRSADRWRLFGFSDDQVVEVLDDSKPEYWPEISTKLKGYGKTALYDTLVSADIFFKPLSLNNRAVLLFTDGNDNRSEFTEQEMLAVLSVLEVPVFVVAIADGFLPKTEQGEAELGLQTLREIAKVTGGELFLVRNAESLSGIWYQLEHRLRPQYLATITVERGVDDRHHHIVADLAGHRRLDIRSRRGYLGSLPTSGGN